MSVPSTVAGETAVPVGGARLRPELAAFFTMTKRSPRVIPRPRHGGVLAELAELGDWR